MPQQQRQKQSLLSRQKQFPAESVAPPPSQAINTNTQKIQTGQTRLRTNATVTTARRGEIHGPDGEMNRQPLHPHKITREQSASAETVVEAPTPSNGSQNNQQTASMNAAESSVWIRWRLFGASDQAKESGSLRSLGTQSSAVSSDHTAAKLKQEHDVYRFETSLQPLVPPLSLATSKAASPNGKESCCDPKRTATEMVTPAGSTVIVDHKGISREKAGVYKKKGILLQMAYYVDNEHRPFIGQCGIVRSHAGKVRLCTANHNVMNNCDKLLIFANAHVILDGSRIAPGDLGRRVIFKKENLEETETEDKHFLLRKYSPLRQRIKWKYGWDITISPLELKPLRETQPRPDARPQHSTLHEKLHRKLKAFRRRRQRKAVQRRTPKSDMKRVAEDLDELIFDTVGPNVEFRKGQKIAIVVVSANMKETATPHTAASFVKLNQDQCNTIYGQPGTVAIYTGEITYVGMYHIEHNINTYDGCSGAIIFLLDTDDQLATVNQEDRGKAIAVHVGYGGELLHSNIGFKINKGTSAPWWYRLQLPQLWCFGEMKKL
jgi:hypothetical protein